MGGFQSTLRDRRESDRDDSRTVETVGLAVVEHQEHHAGSSSSEIATMIVDKSCAIVENKSKVYTTNDESAGACQRATTEQDNDEEPDEFESCDGGENCDRLIEFRDDLARKRELRKAKMAEIKRELEQLRESLSEEKHKNRALIRHIHMQDLTAEPASLEEEGRCPSTESDATAAEERQCEQVAHNNSETPAEGVPTEQSDSGETDTNRAANVRLALKKDLAESQLQLQQANGEILALHSMIAQLRTQIESLKTPSEEEEAAKEARNKEFRQLKVELADSQFQLQISNAEVLALQSDISQLKNQIKGLKDVIKAGKEIINIREDQVEQLKGKLRQIEESLQERELQIMSSDLRREYERQMANIRNLRELYEERERVSRMERDNLLRQLELRKNDLEAEQEKNKNLEAHVAGMQADLETTKNELIQTKEKLDNSAAESRQLQAEMTVVNQFISKFLLGMSRKQATSDVKLDKLAEVLEENRGLLIEMTKEEAETIDLGAFLPRALYDLVAEVDEENELNASEEADDSEASGEFTEVQKASPEQIADKLPKVWRVLIELVNHQEQAEQVPFIENGDSEDCLKSEQTKNGPKTVVSVSKTYLKLKDLILEKKALKKETTRLKTLNTHLERRLETQEKRLSAVSLELTKTWHLVGRMQRQHRQLHTQEQILRYHLQQKRRLLSELKEELEYCRMKWTAARQKNIESEDQWKMLKADFAARKKQDSLNNSGESGYSDEQPTDDEDEDYRGKAQQVNEFRELLGNFRQFRSMSVTNVVQTAQIVRKCHSESDMKSLANVERANQFCNEKIEDLPIFPEEEMGCSVKKKSKKSKRKKERKAGPETAEEMFLRLSGLVQEPNEEQNESDSEEDISDDSQCSEIEKIDQRESSPAEELPPQVELTSEEIFNIKREARLKRMAELNSRLDNYTTPNNAKSSTDSNIPETDIADAGPSSALSSTAEDYLQKRAARLERLEREAQEFRNKLSRTVNRGSEIAAQIDEIHNGFIARQSESPVPAASTENRPATPRVAETTPADLASLTDREREYTLNRSERLVQLENEGQALINQMNRTIRRGTRLTTQLDMLHSRYSSTEQRSSDSEGTANDTPLEVNERTPASLDHSPTQELQREPELPDTVLLQSSIATPFQGPIELVLVSDEEILAEVEVVLPSPLTATSSHNDTDLNERDEVGEAE